MEKSRPIILVNEGCAMSSHTTYHTFKLLQLHKYDVDFLKTEPYTPEKNPYYTDGMSILNMLHLTVKKHKNLVFKLPINFLLKKEIHNMLVSEEARICIIQRENLLDITTCFVRDFLQESESQTNKTFGEWRTSEERSNTLANENLILDELARQQKVVAHKTHFMNEFVKNQKSLISAEKLSELCFSEHTMLFEILGFTLDKNIFDSYIKQLPVKEKYNHSDVIHSEDLTLFKKKLDKMGCLHFWR